MAASRRPGSASSSLGFLVAASALAALIGGAAALDNGLIGLRGPPLGCSSWTVGVFSCKYGVPAGVIHETAGVMDVSSAGLNDAGYECINIDDCRSAKNRTASGDVHDVCALRVTYTATYTDQDHRPSAQSVTDRRTVTDCAAQPRRALKTTDDAAAHLKTTDDAAAHHVFKTTDVPEPLRRAGIAGEALRAHFFNSTTGLWRRSLWWHGGNLLETSANLAQVLDDAPLTARTKAGVGARPSLVLRCNLS
jgi:hypothetical protein